MFFACSCKTSRLVTKLQMKDKSSSFTDGSVTKKYSDNNEPKTLPGNSNTNTLMLTLIIYAEDRFLT